MRSTYLLSVFIILMLGNNSLQPISLQAAEIKNLANGSTPTQSIRQWHLQEQWCINADDEDFLFGWIIDVKQDDQGNTYFLDYQTQEVTVFSAKGEFQKTLGRKGEGPGETNRASKLFFRNDGGIGLLEGFPAAIVWLSADGIPAGKSVIGPSDDSSGFVGCWSGSMQFGHLVVAMSTSVFVDEELQTTNFVAGILPDGSITHTYRTLPDDVYLKGSSDGEVNEGKSYHQLINRWDVDPAGNLWFAGERDQYLVQCANPEGVVLKSFTKEIKRPKRSAHLKETIRQPIAKMWASSGLPIIIGDYDPCIKRLWVMDNKWGCEIWIESAASFSELPAEVMVRYDLFNTDGEFRNQVDIVGEGDPLFDRWYIFPGNRLVMVRNHSSGGFTADDESNPRFDDSALEIIAYRILWEE